MSVARDSVQMGSQSPEGAAPSQKKLQHVVAGDSSLAPLIPRNGVFDGQVSVQGETRIEGTVRGALRGTGRLELGPEARVEGKIECDEICSHGAIIGPVEGHQRVELGPGATVDGDIDSPKLKVADSAIWTGTARVGS